MSVANENFNYFRAFQTPKFYHLVKLSCTENCIKYPLMCKMLFSSLDYAFCSIEHVDVGAYGGKLKKQTSFNHLWTDINWWSQHYGLGMVSWRYLLLGALKLLDGNINRLNYVLILLYHVHANMHIVSWTWWHLPDCQCNVSYRWDFRWVFRSAWCRL